MSERITMDILKVKDMVCHQNMLCLNKIVLACS